MNKITYRIEEEMNRRGWTKYRLSTESGVSYTTIQNLFHRGNAPTQKTLDKLCNAMNLSVAELYDGVPPEEEIQRRREIRFMQKEIAVELSNMSAELEALQRKVEKLNEMIR